MQLRYVSHASIQVIGKTGSSLLTDPWLYNPIYGNMMWQFPPCQIPLEEYIRQDVLYISHTHPDHFCPNTLKHFNRKTPVVVRRYGAGFNVRQTLQELGFQQIIELGHHESTEVADGLKITLVTDPNTEDSSLIISDGERAIFNQNDCLLPENELAWIGDHFSIDLGCLFFMGIGPFPGSFDLPQMEKEAAVRAKKEFCFKRASKAAQLIKTRRVVPYSNDMTWLRRPDLAQLNGALPFEFKQYVQSQGSPFEVFLMASGETYSFREHESEYTNFFRTRQDLLTAYEALKNHPDNAQLIKRLEAWESRFEFHPQVFYEKLKAYCEYTTREKIYLNVPEGIHVGWRVKTKKDVVEYKFDCDASKNTVEMMTTPLANLKNELHMIMNVEGHLVEIALNGAMTFQDLENCRFFIERPGPFNRAEDLFWQFISGFSWYLEMTNQQPLKSERNHVKAIASPHLKRQTFSVDKSLP